MRALLQHLSVLEVALGQGLTGSFGKAQAFKPGTGKVIAGRRRGDFLKLLSQPTPVSGSFWKTQFCRDRFPQKKKLPLATGGHDA
jgi:hypothetical protein